LPPLPGHPPAAAAGLGGVVGASAAPPRQDPFIPLFSPPPRPLPVPLQQYVTEPSNTQKSVNYCYSRFFVSIALSSTVCLTALAHAKCSVQIPNKRQVRCGTKRNNLIPVSGRTKKKKEKKNKNFSENKVNLPTTSTIPTRTKLHGDQSLHPEPTYHAVYPDSPSAFFHLPFIFIFILSLLFVVYIQR
jgi:hypothetical protein